MEHILITSKNEDSINLLKKIDKKYKLAHKNGLCEVRIATKKEKKYNKTPMLLSGEYIEDDIEIIEKLLFYKIKPIQEQPQSQPEQPPLNPYEQKVNSFSAPPQRPSKPLNFNEQSEDEEEITKEQYKQQLNATRAKLDSRPQMNNNSLIQQIKQNGGELDLGDDSFLGGLIASEPSLLKGGAKQDGE